MTDDVLSNDRGASAGHRADVVVVGGGPTGMTVAGDLARCGRSVTVLERWPEVNPHSRAFVTMARTLEVLEARGSADELLALGHPMTTVNLFGGARIDLDHLRSRYRYALVTPQDNVDRLLGRYAEAQGAIVVRGVEVVDLTQDGDGVTLTAQPKGSTDPGERSTWRASYVVGADGAHSTVRRLVGEPFPGRSVLSSVVLADVELTDGPTDAGPVLGSTARDIGFLVPYNRRGAHGSWYRAMTWDRRHQVADDVPVRRDEVVEVLTRAMKRDVGVVDIGWCSRFHCDERQVAHYRRGRVFLAGDAAHVHSPMGGQGMNTGIQDAANLSWKLDAVLGGADDAVLDTYHAERHPIGRRVIRQSGLMMRSILIHPPIARALRDLVVPPFLRFPLVRDRVVGSFAGTELRYPRSAGQHRLVGTRATEVPLREGRLTELQRTPGFVLAREHGGPVATGPVTAGLRQVERLDNGPALLIRPDGYIAWAGPSAADRGGNEWVRALDRWTGRCAPTMV
nr:FAD-dependent monooxygenase [Nocardia paucivorans]